VIITVTKDHFDTLIVAGSELITILSCVMSDLLLHLLYIDSFYLSDMLRANAW